MKAIDFIKITRLQKKIISYFIDFFAISFLTIFALWLRLGKIFFIDIVDEYGIAILLFTSLSILIYFFSKLYSVVVREISYAFIFNVFKVVTSSVVIWTFFIYFFNLNYPKTGIVIVWLLLLVYLTTTRLLARWFFTSQNQDQQKKIAIFGAGDSAKQILKILKQNPNYKVLAMVDDDKNLHKTIVNGIQICSREKLKRLIVEGQISEVFFAISSLKFSRRKKILNWLEKFSIKVRLAPPINQIVEGKINYSMIRNIDISDVLGRDETPSDHNLLSKCITNKTVMITGSGGSIGQELSKQVLNQKPKMLILFEQSELALYQIHQKLKQTASSLQIKLIPILGSVLDQSRLTEVFEKFKPNTIYHAAAYKHVPLVELNIKEGIKTNTFGTYKIAQLANHYKVDNFLLISTDKAVRPTNFMGASKRLAEMVIQAIQNESNHTLFTIVRFGNVLDSSGSVVPLFKEQIKSGGPVTVTHPEITRYFMTISEAVSLVIQSSGMSKGGEVFVLEMGEPVKIIDLAKKMISLSGFQVAQNQLDDGIGIEFTGLRPGEKLYEELVIGENVTGTKHPRILKAMEDYLSLKQLDRSFEKIESCLNKNNFQSLSQELKILEPGFNHNGKIIDLTS